MSLHASPAAQDQPGTPAAHPQDVPVTDRPDPQVAPTQGPRGPQVAPEQDPQVAAAASPAVPPPVTARHTPSRRAPVGAAPWWRLPFTAEPWRHTGYLAATVPAALVAVVDGGRWQAGIARRLLGREVAARRLRGLPWLPYDLVALVLTGYCWSLVVLNLGYPLRPLLGLDGSYARSWGGPTLAGAWALHAVLGGVTFLFATPRILRGLTAAHAQLLG